MLKINSSLEQSNSEILQKTLGFGIFAIYSIFLIIYSYKMFMRKNDGHSFTYKFLKFLLATVLLTLVGVCTNFVAMLMYSYILKESNSKLATLLGLSIGALLLSLAFVGYAVRRKTKNNTNKKRATKKIEICFIACSVLLLFVYLLCILLLTMNTKDININVEERLNDMSNNYINDVMSSEPTQYIQKLRPHSFTHR